MNHVRTRVSVSLVLPGSDDLRYVLVDGATGVRADHQQTILTSSDWDLVLPTSAVVDVDTVTDDTDGTHPWEGGHARPDVAVVDLGGTGQPTIHWMVDEARVPEDLLTVEHHTVTARRLALAGVGPDASWDGAAPALHLEDLIAQLERIRERHGNVRVLTPWSFEPEAEGWSVASATGGASAVSGVIEDGDFAARSASALGTETFVRIA